jgi:hypothetical protein
VLLVLDVSGSMNDPAATSDPEVKGSKLDLVKPAATRALDLLSGKDEVGLWTFSSPGFTEHVPVGKLADNKAALSAAIGGLGATEPPISTPLSAPPTTRWPRTLIRNGSTRSSCSPTARTV